MSTGNRIPLEQALPIAKEVFLLLEPHCSKIQVAGSIRRNCTTIGDIEIVCCPRPYDASPLFCSGIATVVNEWPKVRGELPCKYTQRILPSGMKLDLFMVDPDGFGLQLAIRTGSADWCKHVLAPAWVRAGYCSEGGLLHRVVDNDFPDNWDTTESTPDEHTLFKLIGLPWVAPEDREWKPADAN